MIGAGCLGRSEPLFCCIAYVAPFQVRNYRDRASFNITAFPKPRNGTVALADELIMVPW